MDCEQIGDERLQADKMDVLYGEADGAARARLEAHLGRCAACRTELAGFSRLRQELGAWQLPTSRPSQAGRAIMVPRWLAAAAALLLGVAVGIGASGYVSLRRALAAQEARAAALEQRQRAAAEVLREVLAREAAAPASEAALLARLDARLDERLRASEASQSHRLDVRLADWSARAEAQRRVDLARVAEGLSYLDGRHGQQLARTNELMGYVLEATAPEKK